VLKASPDELGVVMSIVFPGSPFKFF